jgi:anti-anti-sigma factor
MSVETRQEDGGQTLVIAIKDNFDFNLHREFREAYRDRTDVSRFVVDLAGTEYIDSAALGMLLLLRESAHAHGAEVLIRNSAEGVQRILEIANFQKLFEIQGL